MGAVKRRLTAELIAARNKLQKAVEEKAEMEESHRAEVKKLKVCATLAAQVTSTNIVWQTLVLHADMFCVQ